MAATGPLRSREEGVLWLSPNAPPSALATFLRLHGLRLQQRNQKWPSARLTALEMRGAEESAWGLVNRRLAVLHRDPQAAARMAALVRQKGAAAHVLTPGTQGLARLDEFEPEAILVEHDSFYGESFVTVRALWAHSVLRWVPLVLVPSERSHGGPLCANDLAGLADTLKSTLAAWDEVQILAVGPSSFEVPVHALGPTGTLRALMRGPRALRATFLSGSMRVEVDIDGSQVIAMRGRPKVGASTRPLEHADVRWLLDCREGTVRIEPLRICHAPDAATESDEIPFASPAQSGVRAVAPRAYDDLVTTVYRASTPPPRVPESAPPARPSSPSLKAPLSQPPKAVRVRGPWLARSMTLTLTLLLFAVALLWPAVSHG